MENIIIVPNIKKDKNLDVTGKVIEKLKTIGITSYIHKNLMCKNTVNAKTYSSIYEECADFDLILVVGGDGTVIEASKYAVRLDIPLLGINLGKMGYLSEVEPDKLEKLDNLKTNKFIINNEMLLELSAFKDIEENKHSFVRLAVNDVVISHNSYLGIADFAVSDSLGNTLTYRADGMIFATPQGSSAYSLSAGGPVVAHDVEGIVATPICPHSFFNRSVIFNADEVLTVTNIGNQNINISIDGRLACELENNAKCQIKKSESKLKMLTFSKSSMFTNLSDKMKITLDERDLSIDN